MTRLVIVEDKKNIREGLVVLLGTTEGIECVADYGNCEDMLAHLERDRPDIILMDIGLPGISGIEGTKRAKALLPDVVVVVLSVYDDDENIFKALCAGASGYLLKDMEPDGLVSALSDIHVGKTVVAPPLTSVLVRFVKGDMTVAQSKGPFNELTPREGEILELMAEGQGNKLIARNLGISDGTVKLHVKAVLRKLGVHSRVEAAVMYIEHNHRVADQVEE